VLLELQVLLDLKDLRVFKVQLVQQDHKVLLDLRDQLVLQDLKELRDPLDHKVLVLYGKALMTQQWCIAFETPYHMIVVHLL
jgi:hypothetical protein